MPLRRITLIAVALLLVGLGGSRASTWHKGEGLDSIRQSLDLHVEGRGFFYNLELFGLPKPGFTIPGTRWNPTLDYTLNGLFGASVGVDACYLFGKNRFWHIYPLVRLWVRPLEGFTVELGALPLSIFSNLPDVLYNPERRMMDAPPLGARISYQNRWVDAGVWIDWRNFIWRNAGEQEGFVLSAKSVFELGLGFTSGLHAFAQHRGGQIDTVDAPTVTDLGMAWQLGWSEKEASWEGGSYGFSLWTLGSILGSPSIPASRKKGLALWGEGSLTGWGAHLKIAYTWGRGYQSVLGDPLFDASCVWDEGSYRGMIQALKVSLDYNYCVLNRGFLTVGAWLYYLPDVSRIGYGYRIAICWDEVFRLWERTKANR